MQQSKDLRSSATNPRDGFRSFLDKAEADGWIASYKWCNSESFTLFREKIGGLTAKKEHSQSHKRGMDGQWWGIEIEAHYGTMVGVDLEILVPRPILEKPARITTRLGIPRNSTPKFIIEEWSSRESAYKALAPDNQKIGLHQFRRTATTTLGVFTPAGERNVQIRSAWSGKWVLTLGWRTV